MTCHRNVFVVLEDFFYYSSAYNL